MSITMSVIQTKMEKKLWYELVHSLYSNLIYITNDNTNIDQHNAMF